MVPVIMSCAGTIVYMYLLCMIIVMMEIMVMVIGRVYCKYETHARICVVACVRGKLECL